MGHTFVWVYVANRCGRDWRGESWSGLKSQRVVALITLVLDDLVDAHSRPSNVLGHAVMSKNAILFVRFISQHLFSLAAQRIEDPNEAGPLWDQL